MKNKFTVLSHTADIGIKVTGKTLAELFSNSAEGMFSLITDLKQIGQKEKYAVSATGKDKEELLVNWLGEILWKFNKDRLIPSKFDIIELAVPHLKANVYGEKYDSARHEILREVKAVTYHKLIIERNKTWVTRIIFDV